MQSNDLIKILNGEITHISSINIDAPIIKNLSIIVSPSHLRTVLQAYLNGDINDISLSCWARFVSLRGEYVAKHYHEEDEKYDDAYEEMWNIISYLSTPEIDGEINPKQVEEYKNKINIYFDSNGNEIDYKDFNFL